MNTTLLRFVRSPRLLAAFRHGRWRAGRMHVSTRPREAVRNAIQSLMAAETPPAQRQRNMSRALRDDRRALYLGMLAAFRTERRLMAAFRL